MRYLILLSIFIFSILSSCNQKEVEELPPLDIESKLNLQKSFFSIDHGMFQPILWGENINLGSTVESIIGDTSKLSPLRIGVTTFHILYESKRRKDTVLLNLGKELLDRMKTLPAKKETSNSVVYYYPFAHKELKRNEWWSGMANSVIALSYLLGAELFEDNDYYNYAHKVLNGVVKHVDKGGSRINHYDSGGYWFCEYAWEGIDEDNSYFVLNGFHFQQLCLKIFAEVTGDNKVEKYYEKGKLTYKFLQDKYHYPDDEWNFYMLNPLTIESVHYEIFDLSLMATLAKVDEDEVYIKQIERRKKALKHAFDIELVQYDSVKKILIAPLNRPHPYWIDTYELLVRFKDVNGDFIDELSASDGRNKKIPIIERGFKTIDYNELFHSYDVYSKYFSDSTLLFSGQMKDIKHVADTKSTTEGYSIYDYNNNKLSRDIVKFVKEDSKNEDKTSVIIEFDNPINIKEYEFIGIELQSTVDLRSEHIVMSDVNGVSADRYYIPLDKNINNFMLLSPYGFKNIAELDREHISKIEFRFYSASDDVFGEVVNLGKLNLFTSNASVKNYFETQTFSFKEK
jgi:hypothetical protein